MSANHSTLTEEQRKRIEENRRKALERRAAFLKSKSNSGHTITNPPISVPVTNSTQNQPSKPNGVANSTFTQSSKFSENIVWKPVANIPKTVAEQPKSVSSFYGNKVPESKSSQANGGNAVVLGKKITGNCHLISKDRFVLNMPYHAQAIDIFKTMPSRQYDISTKKWSFNISDHSALMSALGTLKASVSISPLPSYILQALRKSSSYPSRSSIDLMPLDPSLLEAFMPFQREGVCFGISREGRVLIADDMGLGKTIQALGIAAYYRNEWPLLIVTPSSVRYSWAEAVDRWIETVESYEVMVVNTCKDSLDGMVVIISYDLLSKRAQEIKDMNFSVVIMDESHMLKNFKAIRYKSAAPIMKSCKRLILLSGTPALSRPNELYTQISSIDPKLISNFQDYGIRYCAAKQQPWGWDFSGSSNMEELQILLESTIMIRRLKSEVITQLPSKQRMTILLDPSSIKLNAKALKEAATNFRKESLKGAEKHGALIQFFNESSFAKAKAVCDYVKELLTEGNKKFLIFAHHKIMLNKISEVCEEQKVHYIRIDGNTNSESRQKLVDHFQTNPDTRVAVLSITAASSGLTLTAAQLVVFAELYWNPGVLVQAEDRAHRIGQVDSVLVQYLVAKGTADDFIWSLVQSKLNILNKVGLSKDSFTEAASENQKVKKDETLMRYFSTIKDEDFLSDLFEDTPSSSSSSSSAVKRKRSFDDDDEEPI